MTLMGGRRRGERESPSHPRPSLDHNLSFSVAKSKGKSRPGRVGMKLILLLLFSCKCVKDARGSNDTVFKDMDIEGIAEDTHNHNDPFLVSKMLRSKETCSQVS